MRRRLLAPTRSRFSKASKRSGSARRCTSARPALRTASSRLRNRRQLDRRSARGILRSDQRHAAHRRFGHRDRQRPRHSGRSAHERQVGRRGRADGAARRRQVRQRQLQGVRRPARRRRVGGERAVGNARSRNLAQRPGVPAVLRARHARGVARDHRHDEAARHEGHLQAGHTDFRDHRFQLRHPGAAPARACVPERRHPHHARRRARRQEPQVPLRRRHRLVRHAPEQEQGGGERKADLHARREGRHRRRDRRCSGTTATPRRSTPSPTTSTRTRAARICRGSAPR